jgi:hypothetical protein
VRYHGLDPRYLTLKRAHARVEDGHRQAAWRMVLDHTRNNGEKMLVTEALERSLELWHGFRDGVAKASGVTRETRRSTRKLSRTS